MITLSSLFEQLASVDLVDVDLTPTLENMRGLALQLISFEGVVS